MVLASPLRTVDTTSTDGVGTYTLDDPASPGGGLRTLADAVAMGHVSDGDTIEYNVEDDTTEGAALLFEEGVGTVGNSGLTVTRDTILSNHNGDTNPVNWQTGGSRSFTVSLASKNVLRTANNGSDVDDPDAFADNIGAARLNAANVFTAGTQTMDAGSGIAQVFGRSTRNTAPQTVAVFGGIGKDAGGNNTTYADLLVTIEDPTEGSEDGRFDFRVMSGGVQTIRLRLESDGTLSNPVSGNTYEAFPSGTTLSFGDSAPPAGWTRQNVASDRVVKLAKSGDTGGSNVSQSATITVNATTLTEAQIPSHTHGPGGAADFFLAYENTSGVTVGQESGATTLLSPATTAATGGGGSHTHTASISSGFYPQAEIWIKATKD